MGNFDNLTLALIVIAILFIIFGMLFSFICSYMSISSELKHIKIEIKRTHGREKKHWKRRKRRLLLTLLPIFKK